MAAQEDAMKLFTGSLILMSPILLGGCYTVRGFGQDVAAAGRALTNAADTVMGSASPPATTQLPPPGQGSSTMPQSLSPAPTQPATPK
jgi:predicted small secreted protein